MTTYTLQTGKITAKGQRTQVGVQTGDVAVAPTRRLRTEVSINPVIETEEYTPESSKAPTNQTLLSDTSEGEFSSQAVPYNELQIWHCCTLAEDAAPVADGTNGYQWEYDLLPDPQDVTRLTIQTLHKYAAFTRGQQAHNLVGKSISLEVDKSGFKLAGMLIGGKLRDTADQGSPAFTDADIPDITDYVAGTNDQTISRKDVCVYVYQAKAGDAAPYASLKKRCAGGWPAQVTADVTLTAGDTEVNIATAIQTALDALGCFDAGDVTVTAGGSGGPLGTADAEVTLTFSGDYTHELMPLVSIINGTNTTPITVARTTPGDATTDEVQTITIPSASAGTFTIQANIYQTVLLPNLQSHKWEISDRWETEEPVRCDDVTLPMEGFGSSLSLKHEASDALLHLLANLRGDAPDGRHLVWIRMEARGPVIAGATPSQYRLTVDSAAFLKVSSKMVGKDGKLLSASMDGVLAVDPIFVGGATPGMGRVEIVNTQATVLA